MSPGRRRGLAQLAGPRGGLALALLQQADPSLRRLLCRTLGPHVTGVVLDPEGAAAAVLDGSLPGRCGLAVDLAEPTPPGAVARLRAGCPPADARRLGASAAFLRLSLRPDHPELAEQQLRVARLALQLCHEEELPLVLHVVVEPLPAGEPLAAFCERQEELEAACARAVAALGADLVLAPIAAGARLRRPWACALTALDPADLEAELLRACSLGARGFAIGAALSQPGLVDETSLLAGAVPLAAALRELTEQSVAVLA